MLKLRTYERSKTKIMTQAILALEPKCQTNIHSGGAGESKAGQSSVCRVCGAATETRNASLMNVNLSRASANVLC